MGTMMADGGRYVHAQLSDNEGEENVNKINIVRSLRSPVAGAGERCRHV